MTTALSTLERTSRRIVAGTWGCAAIVMIASAANAALTYGAIGDNRVLGLATGVAVDIALCVALIGDRWLYVHGLSSNWGRALRVTAAVMSLILNVGISLRDGHYFAALLHSFLPVLLIVLCEYGQDVLLQFAALARDAERAPQFSDPGPSEPGSGGLGRPGSDRSEMHNTPLGDSGPPAGRALTVVPPADGGPDRSVSPLWAGSTNSPVRSASPAPGWPPAGAVVSSPQAAPVRSEVPAGRTVGGQPDGPPRSGKTAGDSVGDSNGSTADRSGPTVRKTGPSSARDGKRAGPVQSDDDLMDRLREMADRSDGPLSAYAIKQELGVGSTRAARLRAQLNGHVKEAK